MKNIYRIPPCPVWDTAALESWLEDQETAGFRLNAPRFCELAMEFLECAPATVRYRLEPVPKRTGILMHWQTPEPDRLELYRALGWEYICTYSGYYIYRTADPGSPELNTDPAVQALGMKKLKNRSRTAAVVSLLLLLPMLLFFVSYCFLLMAQYGNSFILLQTAFLAVLLVEQIRTWVRIRRLIKRLSGGAVISHRKDWRSGAKGHYLYTGICWVLVLIYLIAAVQFKMVDLGFGTENLNSCQEALPILTYPELAPGDGSAQIDRISNGAIRHWTDLFTVENYEMLDGGSYAYAGGTSGGAILEVRYHEACSPWLARQIAEDYIDLYRLRYQNKAQALPELGLDYAYGYFTADGPDAIVLQQGSVVIFVKLGCHDPYGNFTTENWAKLTAQQLLAGE